MTRIVCHRYIRILFLGLAVLMVGCGSPSNKLKWNKQGNYRWATVDPGYFGDTGFKALPSSTTNINFRNFITEEAIAENRHYLNGSGVAAGDVDGDGLADLYFARLDGPNVLYKNMGGMGFKDVTKASGVAHKGYYSTGAVLADVNGDGAPDLLVTAMHKQNVLYINDGSGHFSRKENSGLGSAKGSMTATLADIDGDNDLDLYISNYKEKSIKDIYSSKELAWENMLKGDLKDPNPKLKSPFDENYELFLTDDDRLAGGAETGEEDELYINEGDGTFRNITDSSVFLDENGSPMQLKRDWGLTAKFQDINKDGLPDLYVCNDFFSPDRIWINQGNGSFKEIRWQALRNASFSSMAVDFSDINKDGRLDMFVTEMLSPEHHRKMQQIGINDFKPNVFSNIQSRPQYNRNSLYLQRQDTTFAEIAYFSGLEASEWSWATRFIDINLDGFEDLLINTGYAYDILDIDSQFSLMQDGMNVDDNFGEFIKRTPSLELQNKIFKNEGDLSFTDKSEDWGLEGSDVSQGLAMADFDNDGDLDFAINRLRKPGLIYENTTTAPRIAVRLKGNNANSHGIGAKISLEGGPQLQEKEITSGGEYLSGSVPMAVFAATEDANHTIIVEWPNGSRSTIDSVKANRIYEINQIGAKSEERKQAKVAPESPTFKDVSNRINHQHHENFFDDFSLQPLLPKKLSELGPGITWFDIDNDKDDDLFITSGKGGTIGAFENTGNGSFRPISTEPFNESSPSDQTTLLGWNSAQSSQLIVGNANYETGNMNTPSALIYSMDQGREISKSDVQGILSVTGPVAAADYNQDGDIDLFLGGRFVPAHYPNAASSRFFENVDGDFRLDKKNSSVVRNEGLVTAATFTDYDQDGDPDLLLSLEWGSLKLFENNRGRFHEVTDEMELSGYKGWWNGVTTGDFNNDGLPDIVATNQGLNSTYQLKNDLPLRMYYSDFNGDGITDIIEAQANAQGHYVPRKRLYNFKSIPPIASRQMSYEQFGSATLRDIFGDRLNRIPYKEINTLSHMLFINTGEGFEPHPLPTEAQFTTAYYAGTADYNNDGNEDLFLSQNFFAVPREVPRLDSGRGLWLKGDGNGNFSVVPGSESGIKIYGEQRGAALSDFNKDGKVDLAVSQNGAATKLYINHTEKAGIRIKLDGPKQNKSGIGSSVRLVYTDGSKGPLREIKAGSGYWSQNSFTQVLGMNQEVEKIEVRWFNNRKQTVDITGSQKNYVISYPLNK